MLPSRLRSRSVRCVAWAVARATVGGAVTAPGSAKSKPGPPPTAGRVMRTVASARAARPRGPGAPPVAGVVASFWVSGTNGCRGVTSAPVRGVSAAPGAPGGAPICMSTLFSTPSPSSGSMPVAVSSSWTISTSAFIGGLTSSSVPTRLSPFGSFLAPPPPAAPPAPP